MQNNLQKQFPEVYAKLFSEYELVLSAHFGFNRFPTGVNHVSQYLGIKQKIDSKCYVGIKKIAQQGIFINTITMYDGETFIDYGQENIENNYKNTLELVKEYIDKDNKKFWYTIAVLTESTRGEGLWFTWTVFSLVVAGLGIMTGKYKASLFDDYATFERSTYFQDIKSIAHQCTRDIKRGNIGHSFYTTMLETAHPHIYLSEDYTIKKISDLAHIKEYYNDIPTMAKIQDSPFRTLPIRWAMVYTWQRANPLFVEKNKPFTKNQNDDYSKRFQEQDWYNINTHIHDIFAHDSYHNVLSDGLSAMSVKTLYIFANIYKYGPRIEYIKDLIHHFNTMNSMYNDIEHDFDITSDFVKSCVNCWVSPQKFWYFSIYTTKHGGNYIVIFEDDSDLQVLERIIANMKKMYPEIRIAHTYDFDNPPAWGIQIEQNMYQHSLSEHTQDTYVLIDNKGNQTFCQYVDVVPTQTKWLFLDAVKSKVYLDGQALTSKDIKSQTTTIEIFDLILQDAEHTIKNNQLWPSTFSGQQNQMLGKIVYPLTKLIQAKIGKDFPLECTWSLREFRLKLGKTDIPVVLIKKM